ncbi:uncharacterized protein LOC143424061 [Xylocopa sonorina]|uniref:uncharacterized protein LOC143424061 n=1 Tax=Xylocopa sonorina TaxID=1818115 RepID=UPI00403B33F1
MTVKGHRFVAVLVTLSLFVIIVASDSNEIKPSKDDEEWKAFDVTVKGRKLKVRRSESPDEIDTTNDLQMNVKPSLKRLVLYRTRVEPKISNEIEARPVARKGDEAADQGIQRPYEGRFKRNASPLNESRSEEKMRLDQIRVMHEDWKRRECSNNFNDDKYSSKANITRRHDEARIRRTRRNAITTNIKNDDYYAQRKAVMDKYYAREKEIETKYGSVANRLTGTPNRIQVTILHNGTSKNTMSHNINDKKNAGTRVSKTTAPTIVASKRAKTNQQVRRRMITNLRRGHRSSNGETGNLPENNGDEYGSGDYYDSYEDASNQTTDDATSDKSNEAPYNAVDDKSGKTSNNTIDIQLKPTSDTIEFSTEQFNFQQLGTDEPLTWGNCTGVQMYQHNLNVSIRRSSSVYVDLLAMLEGSICVTCIRVIPLNLVNAVIYAEVRHGQDGSLNVLKLGFRGVADVKLSYVVKIWAVGKYSDRCENV